MAGWGAGEGLEIEFGDLGDLLMSPQYEGGAHAMVGDSQSPSHRDLFEIESRARETASKELAGHLRTPQDLVEKARQSFLRRVVLVSLFVPPCIPSNSL